MANRPLLFYDSGAGGLPYLAAARTALPDQGYVYLADRANFPLGEKPEELIRQVVVQSISIALKRFDPRLVVIACNTASGAALQELRERFSVPFVGVVPAVKPATLSGAGARIAVVATRQTAAGPYLEGLIREFADEQEVVKVPVANLVDFAEYRFLSASAAERLNTVREALEPVLGEDVQAVVLGCTHFLLLQREFRAVLPEAVALIDSREGVARRIVSLVSEQAVPSGRIHPHRKQPRAGLYLHGGVEDQDRYRAFARHFGLDFRGLMEDTGR
jgi:glutamate racemase